MLTDKYYGSEFENVVSFVLFTVYLGSIMVISMNFFLYTSLIFMGFRTSVLLVVSALSSNFSCTSHFFNHTQLIRNWW